MLYIHSYLGFKLNTNNQSIILYNTALHLLLNFKQCKQKSSKNKVKPTVAKSQSNF